MHFLNRWYVVIFLKILFDFVQAREDPKGTIIVGGPPALISSANESGPNVTYINDERQIPIAIGSAYHLEWDSPSEAPTSFKPSDFMIQQIKRLIIPYTLKEAEETGLFPWRSLDWAAWVTHPDHWVRGIRLALAFQKGTSESEQVRNDILRDCAERCKANEQFYNQLDKELLGTLLMPGKKGSIIVARTEEEVEQLDALQASLIAEGRSLTILSREELMARYGFVPTNGLKFAEKPHDRALDPNFMHILKRRLQSRGCDVVNGVVTTIYTDNPEEGGYVGFVTNTEGEQHKPPVQYRPFKKLIVSPGNQKISEDYFLLETPLEDIVAARGISAIGYIHIPTSEQTSEQARLPSATVCGATNHVTSIAGPVTTTREGKSYQTYLVKLTCSACITPNVTDVSCTHYDAHAAVGLMTAVRRTIPYELELLTVWGCNRQMSKYGQGRWFELGRDAKGLLNGIEVKSSSTYRPRHSISGAEGGGIFVQLGAGGGGLTQGPAQPPIEPGSSINN